MRVTVDLAAEADIAEVADFYDEQEPGLGAEVEAFLIECLSRLETLAGIHPQQPGHLPPGDLTRQVSVLCRLL